MRRAFFPLRVGHRGVLFLAVLLAFWTVGEGVHQTQQLATPTAAAELCEAKEHPLRSAPATVSLELPEGVGSSLSKVMALPDLFDFGPAPRLVGVQPDRSLLPTDTPPIGTASARAPPA